MVQVAQSAARRAAALTHRLLAFSRRQTLNPQLSDINALMLGMEDLIRRTAGPQIELEFLPATGLWTTLVDQNQLENALLNLCLNSRDAMPLGGKLTVETGNVWLEERSAHEHDLAPGPYVSLSVSDTGTGMSRSIKERAFEPFFTTKPIGEGTGLGLSMIYGFARQSEGQVLLYSEEGKGTMVRVYLPKIQGELEAQHEPTAEALRRSQEGETVLIVDDEPTIRMLAIEVLAELGYRVLEAPDGPSALAILNSTTRIDLLVTDVGLPGGMNGRQLADATRVCRPALNVLFITGFAENAVINHGHLAPGMQILTKPFSLDMLAAKIQELLGQAAGRPR
jgi:CheY-like chemotaxis protein